MTLADDPQRWILAVISSAVYLTMCLMIARAQWAKRHDATRKSLPDTRNAWRVAYASQTGTAEALAQQTTKLLQLSGSSAQLCELSMLDANALAQAERVLFIVSTYGEGNPPDNAALFAQRVMSTALPLDHLHYAVLALGDRSYTHYCGFGHELDLWLLAQGAQALAPLVKVHQSDADAIESWFERLSHLIGTDDAPDWQGPAYEPWQLVQRKLLNAGSAGADVFHIELVPGAGTTMPTWESGDLVQLLAPGDPDRPREYSIASIPQDGSVHLLVRLHVHCDDEPGTASGWLTQNAPLGTTLPLRLRKHPRFRLGENAQRPLILIGNGTGMAGLRGHIKARAAGIANHGIKPTWLIFGERNAQYDFHYRTEIESWHAAGILERVDLVFSRDQHERRYVQDQLLEAGESLRDWVARDAAIYVCGSLKGMAAGVDDALIQLLGKPELDNLSFSGRYRRDVY